MLLRRVLNSIEKVHTLRSGEGTEAKRESCGYRKQASPLILASWFMSPPYSSFLSTLSPRESLSVRPLLKYQEGLKIPCMPTTQWVLLCRDPHLWRPAQSNNLTSCLSFLQGTLELASTRSESPGARLPQKVWTCCSVLLCKVGTPGIPALASVFFIRKVWKGEETQRKREIKYLLVCG